MATAETTTSTHHDTHTHHSSDRNHQVDQMLRLRIIDGAFENLNANADTYAVVSIGKQSARTKVVKNSNHPNFEENFAIGYELVDEKSEIVIDVFEKGHLTDERIGEFRLKLAQVDPPKNRKAKNKEVHDQPAAKADTALPTPSNAPTVGKKDKPAQNAESWANAQPQKALLVNRKGDKVGFVNILVRRELRLHGNLNIHIREVDLAPMDDTSFWAKPTSLVAKLGQERHEHPLNMTNVSSAQKVPAEFDVSFQVNDNNNISDVFFELWQNGQAIGEARLPLYDTRKRYNGSLAFIGPFGGHDVTNTNQKKTIATLFLNSTFQDQMLA